MLINWFTPQVQEIDIKTLFAILCINAKSNSELTCYTAKLSKKQSYYRRSITLAKFDIKIKIVHCLILLSTQLFPILIA